jgi:hypothetical protein
MSRTLDRSELLEDGFRECSGSLLFGPVGEVPVAREGPAEGVRSSAGTLGKRALRLDGVRGCAGELLCDPTVEFPAAVKGTVEGLRVAAGTLGRRELRLDGIRGGSDLSLVLFPPIRGLLLLGSSVPFLLIAELLRLVPAVGEHLRSTSTGVAT